MTPKRQPPLCDDCLDIHGGIPRLSTGKRHRDGRYRCIEHAAERKRLLKNAACRRYYDQNPSAKLASTNRWRKAHPDAVAKIRRRYYEKRGGSSVKRRRRFQKVMEQKGLESRSSD